MKYIQLGAIIFVLLCLLAIDLFLGDVRIPVSYLFQTETPIMEWNIILFEFRIPKIITGLLVGIALSVSGLVMQIVFRNPLADPYILGISSGAGLSMAVVVIAGTWLGWAAWVGNSWWLIVASCAGAMANMLLILLIAKALHDRLTILIIGIMISGMNTSLISILQYFSEASLLKNFTVWTMGTISDTTGDKLLIFGFVVLVSILMLIFNLKYLSALFLSDNYAQSLGMNVQRWRMVFLLLASVLTGAVVAFCGPIGFVGMVVPHICRMLFKTNHVNHLFFLSIVAGMAFVIFADILANLPQNAQLPLNSVASLIGIPFVIFVLIEKKQ